MDEARRRKYANEAMRLGEGLTTSISSGSEIDDRTVWEVYAGVEKLIAVLRFRLDHETPGSFAKLPNGSPAHLLNEASSLISRSVVEITGGQLIGAVGTLRLARNDLRSYLRSRRLAGGRQSLT